MAPRSRAHEVLPPSKLRASRRKSRILKSALWMFLVLTLMAGAVGLLHIGSIRIHDVSVAGAVSVSSQTIEAKVKNDIQGSIWFIIPSNSVLVYSSTKIKDDLLQSFPKLKSVEVKLETFHGLKITVTERVPVALWCGAQGISQNGTNDCYFIDEDGYVYETAPSYSGSTYIHWYGAIADPDIPSQYLLDGQFHSVAPLIESFKTPTQTPLSVLVDSSNDVFIQFTEQFEIRFNLSQKPQEVLTNLRAAQSSSILSGKKLSDLEYLDLRFGNRLYFKAK